MQKFSPSKKLAASVSLLLLIVSLTSFSLWKMLVGKALETSAQQHSQVALLTDIMARQLEFGHGQAMAYILVDDQSARRFYQSGLKDLAISNAQLRSQIAALIIMQPKEKSNALYQDFLHARQDYVDQRDAALASLASLASMGTDQANAKRLISSKETKVLFQNYINSIEILTQYHQGQAALLGIQAAAASQTSLYGLIINSLLALGLVTRTAWRNIHRVDRRRRVRTKSVDISGPRQRREHFRVRIPVTSVATFVVLDPSIEIFNTEFSLFDVSTGGCRLTDPENRLDQYADSVLQGRLDLPGANSVQIELKILRVNELLETGTQALPTVAGKFHEQTTQQRAVIQKYIDLLDRKLNKSRSRHRKSLIKAS